MANWCANALEIQCANNDVELVIEKLFNGEFVNRTNEITVKMQKILLAGIAGILVPHVDTPPLLIQQVAALNKDLFTDKRENSEKAKAYSRFLKELMDGTLSPANYEPLDSLYQQTKLGQLWWGDIPKVRRLKLKELWRRCSLDFSGKFRSDISRWWSQSNEIKNTSKGGVVDMRVLAELPLKIMVNGFNGDALRCTNTYYLYGNEFGTKCSILNVNKLENGNYSFDTPWSPPLGMLELLPQFVATQLNLSLNEVIDGGLVTANLYYFEGGNCFQGINEDSFSFFEAWDEESNTSSSNMHPDIEKAFGNLD